MIITLSVNEWNGFESPQGMIENWEIEKNEDENEEDWMDLF